MEITSWIADVLFCDHNNHKYILFGDLRKSGKKWDFKLDIGMAQLNSCFRRATSECKEKDYA